MMSRWVPLACLALGGLLLGGQNVRPKASPSGAARGPRTVRLALQDNLQQALDQALPGDTILLQAGAVFLGNFRLPKKDGDAWITIASSDLSSLPADRRAGIGQLDKMPRLVTPNADPVITAAPGAHHYRLQGLELTVATGIYVNDLFRLGELDHTDPASYPYAFDLDRLCIHGDPKAGGKRGVFVNAKDVNIRNSSIYDWKSPFQDAQAVLVCNAPGPVAIANNRLEGSGENVMLGGCPTSHALAIPSTVRITHNYFYKPLAWKNEGWSVKNLFEIKMGKDVWIEGNVFENNWPGSGNGFGIVLTARAETFDSSGKPWGVVENVTFNNNLVINSPSGINVLGRDSTRNGVGQLRNLTIRNNLFKQVSSRWLQMLDAPDKVTVDHNTNLETLNMILMFSGLPSTGFAFTNNICASGEYGIFGDGKGMWQGALDYYAPGWTAPGNVFIQTPSSAALRGSWFVSKLADLGLSAGDSYRLSPSSKFKGKATDGKDPGVDLDALRSATEGTVEGVMQMPKISAVVSDPTYGPELSLGGRIRIFGQNMASCEKISDFPLPKTSCDATLTLNGQPVFLYYAGPQQLLALLPGSLPPGQDITAQVETDGVVSEPFSIPGSNVAQYSPGAYLYSPDGGAPHALLLNSDGSLNGPAGDGAAGRRPMRAGETVYLIAGGLGPADPPVVEGEAATTPSAMLSTLAGVFVNDVYQPVLAAFVPLGTSGLYALAFALDPATPVRAFHENLIWIQCGGKESPRIPVSLQSS